MGIPEAFANAANAEVIVRLQTEQVGKLEAVKKLSELPVAKK